MKIIFFGTPPCAIPTLQALVKEGFDVVGVVTQSDKPAGRGLKLEQSPIKVRALELGLKVFDLTEAQPLSQQRLSLEALKPDLGIVVAYGKIIPQAVLDIFPRGVLNIHPSLLPKYRGPSPVQNAILNGDQETGVTIMLLDDKMDHGPILAQSVVNLVPPLKVRGGQEGLCTTAFTTGGELLEKLMELGAELLVKTLPKYLNNKIIPQEQKHTQATITKLLTRADGQINWNQPAEYIERMIRAYNPWPGTWTTWNNKPAPIRSDELQSGKRLKILSASPLPITASCDSAESQDAKPGYVWQNKNGQLVVNCNPGTLVLEQLQLEGKKSMTHIEFLQGHPLILNSTFSF